MEETTARGSPDDWRALMRPSRLLALDFGAEGDAAFRTMQRKLYRYPRLLLLGVHAIAFGLGPIYNGPLFGAPEPVQPLMLLLEIGVVLPLLILAMLAVLLKAPVALQQTTQTAAILSVWSGALGLRYLALTEGFDYASQLLGIMLVAVALFGSYSCRRVSAGVLLFTGFGIALEYWQADETSNPNLQAYTLLLMALIAILGAYTIEVFSRLAWVGNRYAHSLARTDALTGLSNRHDFNRLFPRCLSQAAREKRGVGVMLLDIDHFKTINDQHGHPFGDEVLREVGRRLRGTVALRPLDLLARFGGEELVVVWYDIPRESLPELAERVLDSLRGLSLNLPMQSQALRLTASAGALWLQPRHPLQPEQILRQTDALLYEAKAAGRNCFRIGEGTRAD